MLFPAYLLQIKELAISKNVEDKQETDLYYFDETGLNLNPLVCYMIRRYDGNLSAKPQKFPLLNSKPKLDGAELYQLGSPKRNQITLWVIG